jgi:hypothetical protein
MVEHHIALGHRSCRTEALLADARLLTPGRWTRFVARSRHAALDRKIALGADLAASPLLAARAAQLTGARNRNRIAAGLERVAQLSDTSCYPRFRVVPRRAVVRQNRDELIELASILRGDGPAYVRGVALLRRVVTDGAGPAYTDGNGELLAAQLRLARQRLTG